MKIAPFTKSYGGRTVLDFPAAELENGTITAVIGANGSGKTTLARVLAGIEVSDQGRPPIGRCRVGYMPQKSFAFRMSTARNIALGGADPARQQALMAALQLEGLARQRAKKLSGGETARMALARLLMGSYGLLIFDEPTASMDMESTLAAERLIVGTCREQGCPVLLITHSIQQARRCADRVIFLRDGRVAEQGDAAALLTAPAEEATRRFLNFYGL